MINLKVRYMGFELKNPIIVGACNLGTNPDNLKRMEDAGAAAAGLEDLIAEFEKGKFDYDVVVATPDVMKNLGRVAKALGQKGMMPNPKSGTVTPDIEKTIGMYLRRGEQVGFVASLNDVRIRATAGQKLAAMLVEQAYEQLEIRVKGRPDVMLTGRIEKIFPAGQELLPSEALGYTVGGSMPTVMQDPSGVRTAEKFFEIRIRPIPDSSVHLLSGQRVVARIQMPSKPLASQWWRSLRQLFQRRFHI